MGHNGRAVWREPCEAWRKAIQIDAFAIQYVMSSDTSLTLKYLL